MGPRRRPPPASRVLILIDYGHEARELYSATHAAGTLTTFTRHTMAGPETAADTPAWLERPGDQDLTAHVDFTSVRAAAEAEGLTTLGFLDQTYFLLGILLGSGTPDPPPVNLKDSLALKTLLMPGGLGSTHKVLILGKGVGSRRCSDARSVNASRDRPRLHDPASGSFVMIVSEAATLARIEPFWSWNTPIAWTGFILFADGDRLAGAAPTRGSGRRRASSSFWRSLSIPLWIVFEFYNLFIENWHYVGLPENPGCGTSATPGHSPRSGRRFSRAAS